jgi:hypothetical protein
MVTLYPPLQPGVCDACVPYTFTLLARGASVIETVSDAVGNMYAPTGGLYSSGWNSNSGLLLLAIDNAGAITNTPVDMAVRCQVSVYVTPWSGANQTFSLTFQACDNAGNTNQQTQVIVARSWTLCGTWSAGNPVNDGTALTYTTSGTTSQNDQTVVTFGLAAHGLGVGDRVYIGSMTNSASSRPSASIGDGFWFVTAVVDANHFTATNSWVSHNLESAAAGGLPWLDISADPAGHPVSLAYLLAYQSGRDQNDITSPASLSGTAGLAIAPFTIVTDGASVPTAQGVPNGIGLASGILSGTPFAFGWFPVTLIVGTMQRLCVWEIAAGSYASLIIAPQTLNVAVGNEALAAVSAPSLNGTTVNWQLGNAPSGFSINSEYATTALINGVFTTTGSFPILVIATSSNGAVLQTTINFVVSGVSPGSYPVISAATISSVVAGAAINYQFYASGEPTSWSANGLPGTLTLNPSTGTLTGVIYTPGIYSFEVTATNGAGSSSPQQVTLTVSAPTGTGSSLTTVSSAPPQYISWLASQLNLVDLQVDLRYGGVSSYASINGVVALNQGDTCTLAVLLLTPAQVNDATTIYFTARTDVNGPAIISITVTGSAVLTAVTSGMVTVGQYYALALNLSADPITDAINDVDDPGEGEPAVLALWCQLAVVRSGATRRSVPFQMTITERIADAGAAELEP